MSGKFSMDDYVDVAERERQLFERYPDARVQVDLVEVRDGETLTAWAAKATIWRTPDDPIPVCDWAVEPVPGKTPYTRDSEAMNASTSAVGRAIVLAGFPSKKVASADEVRNRSGAGPTTTGEKTGGPTDEAAGSTPAPDTPFKAPTGKRGGGSEVVEKLRSELVDLVTQLGAADSLKTVHMHADAADVPWLKRQIKTAKEALAKKEALPFE